MREDRTADLRAWISDLDFRASCSVVQPRIVALLCLLSLFSLLSCATRPDPNTLVMIIESSPTNLDPRVGIDAQSERIDNLIFDDLLSRGEDLNVAPGLAERWEIPDPLTYVFHLHRGVKFHDGRALTSRDVKWTFDSLLQGRIRSTKAAVYRFVDHIDAPDDATVVFHMKEQDATLLWNLSDGAIGIVPEGSGEEMSRHPIGSGPFQFVSAETDRDVRVERNDEYWGERAKLARVRFAVVPDATTQALELRKGSGDVAINSLTPDTVFTLDKDPNLLVERAAGTRLAYLGFNLRDPILKDARVRQAIAYALDRSPMIEYLWRGQAQPARSVLPTQSWAYNGGVPSYDHNIAKANQLLDAAGWKMGPDGVRAKNGVRLDLNFVTATGTVINDQVIELLRQTWKQIGVSLSVTHYLNTLLFAQYQDGGILYRGKYDVAYYAWGEDAIGDLSPIYSCAQIPPNGQNSLHWCNQRAEKAMLAFYTHYDQAQRNADDAIVMQELDKDVPTIVMMGTEALWVYNSDLKNFSPGSLSPFDNFLDVDI